MLDWSTLVEERNAWVAHNFPDPDGKRTPLDSVLGCVEEVGELTHCHLKQVQAIRGTAAEHEEGARDSIGDLTVYLLGVMNFYKVLPAGKVEVLPRDADHALLNIAEAVGTLAGDQAVDYSSWMKTTVSDIVNYSIIYCDIRGWNYEEIVQETWDAVKQRDWRLYPDTGLPPVPTAEFAD